MDPIIGFVVFAIMILGFVLSAKNKAKQEETTEKPEKSENFPFPFPFPFDEDVPQQTFTTPAKVDELVIAEGRVVAKKPALQRASQMPMATASIEGDMQITKAERSEISRNFDLRQAVIYSMILKPKFDDNIF